MTPTQKKSSEISQNAEPNEFYSSIYCPDIFRGFSIIHRFYPGGRFCGAGAAKARFNRASSWCKISIGKGYSCYVFHACRKNS